jgi:hypothetical protein
MATLTNRLLSIAQFGRYIALCIAMGMGANIAAKEGCPNMVRVTFFDFAVPPLFNGTGTQFAKTPGYLVDWVQKAIAQTSCAPALELERRPIRRAYQEIEHNETDFLATVVQTPEREKIFAFPRVKGDIDRRATYLVTDTSLWVRKGEKTIHWDGQTLNGPKGFKVGVVQGTMMEALARKRGWEVDVAVNGPNSIEKLLMGRLPVTLVANLTVEALPDDQEALMERLGPPVDKSHYYSVPSHGFYAKYPEFVAQYWRALCQLARAETGMPEQRRLPACR